MREVCGFDETAFDPPVDSITDKEENRLFSTDPAWTAFTYDMAELGTSSPSSHPLFLLLLPFILALLFSATSIGRSSVVCRGIGASSGLQARSSQFYVNTRLPDPKCCFKFSRWRMYVRADSTMCARSNEPLRKESRRIARAGSI